MRMGDMEVMGGRGVSPGPKLTKALAVVSAYLHPAFERQSWITPGISRRSCVLCSLTVRDFLWKVGFKDAKVAPVYFAIAAYDAMGAEIHSAGVGDHADIPTLQPKPLDTPGAWSGHMVVLVDGWLVDTTLYQANRPAWAELPGMMAVPLEEGLPPSYGFATLTGFTAKQDTGLVHGRWLDQPENSRWRSGGDAKKERRVPVIKRLVHHFRMNQWREK